MFYTYAHIRLDTNAIFYIGKGKKRRMHRKDARNKHWHNIVNCCGYKATQIGFFDSEAKAFEHEKQMIQTLKKLGVKLVNATDGGDGNSIAGGLTFAGKKHSESAKQKCRIANLGKKKTKEANKKNAESHKQKIQINNKIYESWQSASEKLGIPMGSIAYILKSKPTHGKYAWVKSCSLVM